MSEYNEDAKACHIITVGTSLLEPPPVEPEEGTPEHALERNRRAVVTAAMGDKRPHIAEKLSAPDTAYSKHVVFLLKLDAHTLIERRHWGDEKGPKEGKIEIDWLGIGIDWLPQEISYVHMLHREIGRGPVHADKVFLIASDTGPGEAAARIISAYLTSPKANINGNHFSPPHVEVSIISGLDPSNEKMTEESIKLFCAKIRDIVQHHSEHVIRLNISGGFKGLIPYATYLAGEHFPCVRLCYLFKKSRSINYVPVLPPGDHPLWAQLRGFAKGDDNLLDDVGPKEMAALCLNNDGLIRAVISP